MRAPEFRAGLRYGAEAFALGFLLGVVRTTIIAPAIGDLAAVLCEIPVMLIAMTWRAKHIMTRSALSVTRSRWMMGITGFGVLMLCEFFLGLALGFTPTMWVNAMVSRPGIAGLAGQLAFAALPQLVGARR